MIKKSLTLALAILGSMTLPTLCQQAPSSRFERLGKAEAEAQILTTLAPYLAPSPKWGSSPFYTPMEEFESAIKHVISFLNSITDPAKAKQALTNALKPIAANFKTTPTTVALYLVKAGVPAAREWINTQDNKAERLKEAIIEQINPKTKEWFFHQPDWQIIQIAIEMGASLKIPDFSIEVGHATPAFKKFIEGQPNLNYLLRESD